MKIKEKEAEEILKRESEYTLIKWNEAIVKKEKEVAMYYRGQWEETEAIRKKLFDTNFKHIPFVSILIEIYGIAEKIEIEWEEKPNDTK